MTSNRRNNFSEQDLDTLFAQPDSISPQLMMLYEVLVARLREEFRTISLTTLHLIMIERIVKNYVLLRAREDAPNVVEGQFIRFSDQIDMNKLILGLTAELNKLLVKDDPAAKKVTATLVAETLKEVLNEEIKDQVVKQRALNKLSARLAERGAI